MENVTGFPSRIRSLYITKLIKTQEAHLEALGEGLTVMAVTDTGVDYNHPDLLNGSFGTTRLDNGPFTERSGSM